MVKLWIPAMGLVLVLTMVASSGAQTLPHDEVQVNFSSYFDSFDVSVIYPNVAVTKQVSESTSVTGRYLVDMVSAASIRGPQTAPVVIPGSTFVDVITSASGRTRRVLRRTDGTIIQQDKPPVFDDVRHQYGLGMTQLIAGRMLSLNGIYSKQNDYSSSTIAGTFTQWFAQKNTSLELGGVHSWDRIFPATKDWTKTRDVNTLSANVSQILSKRLIAQLLTSYTKENGYLADAYFHVPIVVGDSTVSFDPIHPDRRIRKAVAGRLKLRLSKRSSLQLGYRYYWDDWKVKSHTISTDYQRYLTPQVILGVGLRNYIQSRAFFFKPKYDAPETFMTSDIKLDSGFSNELQWELTLNGGGDHDFLMFLNDDRLQFNVSLSVYQRHTDSSYWFNNSKDLISTTVNAGIRYRF